MRGRLPALAILLPRLVRPLHLWRHQTAGVFLAVEVRRL